MAGLFMGQQSFGQRHSSDRGHNQHQKYSKKVQKQRAKAYKQNRKAYSRRQPAYAYSRGRSNGAYNKHYNNHRVYRAPRYARTYAVAPWAARRHYAYAQHVYFPDYQTFYDARRRGYTYRHGGRWIFTQSMPSFLVGVNWSNARLEYMNNVPLDVYPQTYYDTYSSRYPAVSLNVHIGL